MALRQKWLDTRRKALKRSWDYGQAFRRSCRPFLSNPSGAAIFAARVVKALVRSPGYGLWAFPSGSVGENYPRDMVQY